MVSIPLVVGNLDVSPGLLKQRGTFHFWQVPRPPCAVQKWATAVTAVLGWKMSEGKKTKNMDQYTEVRSAFRILLPSMCNINCGTAQLVDHVNLFIDNQVLGRTTFELHGRETLTRRLLICFPPMNRRCPCFLLVPFHTHMFGTFMPIRIDASKFSQHKANCRAVGYRKHQ